MMKDEMVYLGHMLDYARSAVNKIEGKEKSDFDEDENLRFALAYTLQVIGEAARNITPETRDRYKQIPWSDITGMRHRIVHNYINVKFEIVWDVVRYELSNLIVELEKIVPPEDTP